MKNAEKFKEVFGFTPDMNFCPADDCNECPIEKSCMCDAESSVEWWESQYNGGAS